MRTANDYLHNPFQNRFNDPVTQRRDECQAHGNIVWLRERNQSSQIESHSSAMATVRAKSQDSFNSMGRVFAGLFSLLLILLVSVFTLMRTF